MRRIVFALAMSLLPATALSAQGQGGGHAAVLLELPASARALGLRNAAVAVPDGAMSLFANPALLAAGRYSSLAGAGQRYFASSTLGAVAGSTVLGPGVAALGIQTLNYGSEPEIVPDPAFGGERGSPTGARVSASDLALTAGYGFGIGPLRAGAAGKFVQQEVAGVSGSAFAADLGASVLFGHGLTAAVAAQHLGGGITIATMRGSLPATVRAGVAAPMRIGATSAALITIEGSKVDGVDPEVRAGAEVSWRFAPELTLTGRAGVADRFADSDAAPATFGASLAAARFTLDYAYESFASFGAMHRVGIRWERK